VLLKTAGLRACHGGVLDTTPVITADVVLTWSGVTGPSVDATVALAARMEHEVCALGRPLAAHDLLVATVLLVLVRSAQARAHPAYAAAMDALITHWLARWQKRGQSRRPRALFEAAAAAGGLTEHAEVARVLQCLTCE
jgi:hypothetical protein